MDRDDNEKLIRTARALAADPEGNEATLVHQVIVPALLKMIGYKREEIRLETHPDGGGKKRMDILAGRGATELVVEAKAAGENLHAERIRRDALNQIRSYIRGRRNNGTEATGLVTNGLTWIRIGSDGLPGTEIDPDDDGTLRNWLDAERTALKPKAGGAAETLKRLCQQRRLPNASAILAKLTGCANPITPELTYGTAAYIQSGETAAGPNGQFTLPMNQDRPRSVGAWVIRLDSGDAGPDDIEDTLAELETRGALQPHADARGAAIAKNGQEGGPAVRAWVRRNGRLTMTTAWQPVCDGTGTAAAKHVDRVFDFAKTVREVEDGLDTRRLQKQFYGEMRDWFQAPAADGRPMATAAALQHLLRIIFCRLMAERGVLPSDILECGEPTAGGEDGKGVGRHRALLNLFQKDLARPDSRPDLPWLNGSLFTPPRGNDPPTRLNHEYRNAGEGPPGLLDILDRYEWITVENRSQAGTHAIDPAVLSCMFESLVATTKPSGEGQRTRGATRNPQMPLGAYYTPTDMAEAMAAEALGGAVRRRLSGAPMSEEEIRTVFGPAARKAWDSPRAEARSPRRGEGRDRARPRRRQRRLPPDMRADARHRPTPARRPADALLEPQPAGGRGRATSPRRGHRPGCRHDREAQALYRDPARTGRRTVDGRPPAEPRDAGPLRRQPADTSQPANTSGRRMARRTQPPGAGRSAVGRGRQPPSKRRTPARR